MPEFGTWPCDEINYIWRHKNLKSPTDRFTEELVTPQVEEYIQKEFTKMQSSLNVDNLVEKTCANSLKIPFINKIFPECKFIFIHRNGYDVASSAKKRWTAKLEMKYIWKKVKFVPLSDLPYYGWRYFINRIGKIKSKEKRLSFWGPIYPNMFKDLENKSLIEVCALQWESCVTNTIMDLKGIDSERIYTIDYETFVSSPQEETEKLLGFLTTEVTDDNISRITKNVSSRSVNNYKKSLSDEEIKLIRPIIDRVSNKLKLLTQNEQ